MKVIASSIDEFFDNAGEYKELLMKIDEVISGVVPDLERALYSNYSITLLGYGAGLYKLTKKGKLPIISIAPQKGLVSVYLMAYKNRKSIVSEYEGRLGLVKYGLGTVGIKRFEDLNLVEFSKMIKETVEWNK